MIAFVGPSSLSLASTVVVFDVKLDFELGTVVDRELCTVVLLDIRPCSELGTGLDRGRRTVVVLDIKLGCKL
jgi:hypothetical protein